MSEDAMPRLPRLQYENAMIESFDPKKSETNRKATGAETRSPSLTPAKCREARPRRSAGEATPEAAFSSTVLASRIALVRSCNFLEVVGGF